MGYLRFASLKMFYAFSKVERLLQNHFQSDSAFIRDSFDHIIAAVANDGMGCFSKHLLS